MNLWLTPILSTNKLGSEFNFPISKYNSFDSKTDQEERNLVYSPEDRESLVPLPTSPLIWTACLCWTWTGHAPVAPTEKHKVIR